MYLEALSLQAKRIWKKLNKFPSFVLAGGTAIALQLGHRRSIDFDFFSKHRIQPKLLSQIESIFKGRRAKVTINNSEQLSLRIDNVSVTFLYYPFDIFQNVVIFQKLEIILTVLPVRAVSDLFW